MKTETVTIEIIDKVIEKICAKCESSGILFQHPPCNKCEIQITKPSKFKDKE